MTGLGWALWGYLAVLCVAGVWRPRFDKLVLHDPVSTLFAAILPEALGGAAAAAPEVAAATIPEVAAATALPTLATALPELALPVVDVAAPAAFAAGDVLGPLAAASGIGAGAAELAGDAALPAAEAALPSLPGMSGAAGSIGPSGLPGAASSPSSLPSTTATPTLSVGGGAPASVTPGPSAAPSVISSPSAISPTGTQLASTATGLSDVTPTTATAPTTATGGVGSDFMSPLPGTTGEFGGSSPVVPGVSPDAAAGAGAGASKTGLLTKLGLGGVSDFLSSNKDLLTLAGGVAPLLGLAMQPSFPTLSQATQVAAANAGRAAGTSSAIDATQLPLANAEAANALALQQAETTGVMPPGISTALDNALSRSQAGIKSTYANLGGSGSTSEAQDIAGANATILGQVPSILASLVNQGIQLGGASATNTSAATGGTQAATQAAQGLTNADFQTAEIQLLQDQEMQQALAALGKALGNVSTKA